ncbi:hypothetical protein [Beijerinckia sp. L45]|uniref:hypothetical protein n=1 Tax=Beijerinckia sp. L45 TaxID=1641855 RepID=UPI00131CAC98|nr:hypothetical protein [Beijerinckia sp. L45]
MTMVHFRLSLERREVAVNPAKVLYVCINATGSCNIHFGKESFIRVQGELDDIIAKLEGQTPARSDEAPVLHHFA